MKQTIFIWTIFVLTFFVQSCCKQVMPTVETRHQIDTVYRDTVIEVFVGLPDDTIDFNFDALCDSLKRGLRPVIHTTVKPYHRHITVDTQKNVIICDADSLRAEIALKTVIQHDLETVIVEDKSKQAALNRSLNIYKGIAIGLGVVVLAFLGIFYIIRK